MSHRKTLKFIFIISFTIAVLYPLINSRIIFPSFTDLLIKNTEDQAIRIGRNLSQFVVSGNNEIKNRSDFIPLIEKAKEDFSLEKVKVFSEKGEIIYSTNSEDIGKINKNKYFFDVIAKGKVFTKHVRKDTETLEGRIVRADVIETYVPVMVYGKFLGAFEIYYDITDKNQVMSNRAFRSSLISFSLFFSFFILITIILLKTDERSEKVQTDKLSSLYRSPFYLLLFMFAAIFVTEIIVMLFLSSLPPLSTIVEAILDASLLVMLASPFLYFFLLRPLLLHIEERKKAEDGLRESHDLLEKRVRERTSELAEANMYLVEDINKRKHAEELLFEVKNEWEDTFNTITDMITIHDKNFNIIRANKAAEKMLNLPLLKKADIKCFKYYHGTDSPPAKCASCDSLKAGRPSVYEGYEPHINKFLEIRAIPRYNSRNKLIGLIHVVRDITERRRSEKTIRESEERYRSLVESTEDSIYLVDREYRYLYMNKQHRSRLGMVEDTYMGEPYKKFHSEKETKLFIQKADRAISTGESKQYEYQSNKDGRYFLQTYSPVKDSEGNITAVTVTSKEITGRIQMEERLRILTITDDLTGLYNRRGFFALADKQVKLAKRMGKGVFLLYADLDNFKMINDDFGHEEGDIALKETGKILREIFRDSDIIARMGGDEFAILALEYYETNIKSLITRLQTSLDSHNSQSYRKYKISLSLGMARFNSDLPLSTSKLLSEADKLMYEQKRHKRHAG
jgi:diguanylate cyclase (GGDEF)-like protein/PAS domain S-box-containing protein